MTSLDARRLRPTDWTMTAAREGGALGALGYGLRREGDAPPAPARLRARVLPPASPCVDAWLVSSGPLQHGQTGVAQWCSAGPWLFGRLEVDTQGADLAALTQRAYADVFAALRAAGDPPLHRVWNYVPAINAEQGGLERYRQFNLGRQQAFIEAGARAFEGAPAACALGTAADAPLAISFLAGHAAAIALENSRQVPAWRYPSDYGPRSPSFSRAVLVDAGATGDTGDARLGLLVSGTASIVGHQTLHAGDVRAQVRETLANLRAVVEAANARGSARFDLASLDLTAYVRHAGEAATVHAELATALGLASNAVAGCVMVEADICRADLLVEIEAHGFAPGALSR